MASSSPGPNAQQQEVYEKLVDILSTIFGSHPGYRAIHAKGVVCEGTFTPSVAATSVSRAKHFQGGSVPVTVRFSDTTGIATIPDADPNANPRGLGLKFNLPDGTETDIVAHSYNGFPVSNAEQFLEFLTALATSGPTFLSPRPSKNSSAAAGARWLTRCRRKPAGKLCLGNVLCGQRVPIHKSRRNYEFRTISNCSRGR